MKAQPDSLWNPRNSRGALMFSDSETACSKEFLGEFHYYNSFPALNLNEESVAEPLRKQAGRDEKCDGENRIDAKFIDAYQFVYVWQSKFQSIPLCAVDAGSPSLQTSSLL
jgi:hypothetical protein